MNQKPSTALLGAGAVAGGVVLFLFDPSVWGFFPRCPLHLLTGLFCPGCGAQRALHALLHLDLGGALRYNALLVASLPLLGYIGVRKGVARWGGRALPAPYTRTPWMLAIAALTLAFFVLRNLAAGAFLAPPP